MPIKVREGGAWVQVSDGSDGASFVTGMIMMFSGTTAPPGWVLCDDSAAAQAANAPDLRDRFVVGIGTNYNLNDAGGSADAVVVEHSHLMRVVGVSGSGPGGVRDAGQWGSGSYPTLDEGVSGTNKNLPPYYALAFIMKT